MPGTGDLALPALPPQEPEAVPRPDSALAPTAPTGFEPPAFDRLTVSGFYVPVLFVEPDVDEAEPGMGIEFAADLDNGDGWGTRLSYGSDSAQAGVLFLTSHHTEKTTGAHCRTYSAYGEYLLGTSVDLGPVTLRPWVGAGAGAAVFDFDRAFHDTGGAAVQARGLLEFEVDRRAFARAGIAGFAWGYPGEWIGYGGYVSLELGVVF